MTRWKKFDLDVERQIHLAAVAWPDEREVRGDGWLGGNKNYLDLTRMPWAEVGRVLELEAEFMDRLASAPNPSEEEGAIEDETYEWDVALHGLDIGIASSVVALSAAGCVPFASCNGGAFGRSHYEIYPLVALYARKVAVPLLLECAEAAAVGLVNGDEGELILHGDTIEKMRLFAEVVMRNADRFDGLGRD